jgi:hypothetical protein
MNKIEELLAKKWPRIYPALVGVGEFVRFDSNHHSGAGCWWLLGLEKVNIL